MPKGFQQIAQSIQNKVYGTYANKLQAIDDMVFISSNVPSQPDEYFRKWQQQIEELPVGQRGEAYELLLGFISNNRPYGFADPIYDEIADWANKNSLRNG